MIDIMDITGYPDIHMKIPMLPDFNSCFLNPLYSPKLVQYFSQ